MNVVVRFSLNFALTSGLSSRASTALTCDYISKGSHVSKRILRVEKKRKIVLIFKDAAAYLPSRSCSVSTMRGHNRDFHAALARGSK